MVSSDRMQYVSSCGHELDFGLQNLEVYNIDQVEKGLTNRNTKL